MAFDFIFADASYSASPLKSIITGKDVCNGIGKLYQEAAQLIPKTRSEEVAELD